MMKKTKIVATLGLVSDNEAVLKQMIENGMNVARLNFSHGSHEWHGNIIKMIRELSAEMGVSVGILGDLQGPRIRTVVMDAVEIARGEFILMSDVLKSPNFQFPISNLAYRQADFQAQSTAEISKKILLDVENIIDDIEVGHEILIEDGLMKVIVREKQNGVLLCEVIDGGTVKNHKGVNIPDAKLKIAAITEKDEKDLKFLLGMDVDFIAMSFVSSGADIEELRDKMKAILERPARNASHSDASGEDNLPQIIAKIERKEAIKNLDDILEHTDAVMVARGDLGIEIEGTKVAVLQKEIVKKSLAAMKPVIVATQMLESMIVNPRPTRAEVSDVTNAVVDHADAVMLSGESASGKYPVESVRTMKEIIENTESSPFDDVKHLMTLNGKDDFKMVIKSAYELAKASGAKAVVLGSASGFTARLFSHFRPEQPMLVVTHNKKTFQQLSLVWGIEAKLYEKGEVFREDIDWLIEDAKKQGVLASGDKIVLILGRTPDGEHIRLIGIKEA